MSYRNKAPLSFNTRKQSHRKDRIHRMQQGRMTLLALCAVVLLLAVTGLIFLICHIAVSLQNRPDSDDQNSQDDNSQIQYELISTPYSNVYLGNLVVVNNSHIYTFPSVEMENVTDYRERVDGNLPYLIPNINDPPLMQSEAAQQLSAMLTQYYRLSGDNNLVVYDAYRTQEEQTDGNYSVAAGYSEHHTGLLVALSDSTTSSGLDAADYSWIYSNCQKYGFIQRYPSGKSGITGVSNYTEAFRYVGIPHATYMAANQLCLEEYVELLRNNHTSTAGTDGAHLKIDVNGDGTSDYEVYYVPANNEAGALTSVPVPSDYQSSVSGDNIGGFIVTIDLNAPK